MPPRPIVSTAEEGTITIEPFTSIAKAQTTLMIEPALSEVPLLDWHSFEKAIEAGYRQTRKVLERADLKALGLS